MTQKPMHEPTDPNRGRTYVTEPLFRVNDFLRTAYAEAHAAELKHHPDSPHRRDWTARAEAVLRGWNAWEAFMEREFANVR